MAQNKARQLLYNKWLKIQRSCNNPDAEGFNKAGGNGIIVVEEWDKFENFYKWSIENGYQEGYILVKSASDDFEPNACKWVSKEDAKNPSNNVKVMVTYNNTVISLNELSTLTGISYSTLMARKNLGYKDEDLVKKVRSYKKAS